MNIKETIQRILVVDELINTDILCKDVIGVILKTSAQLYIQDIRSNYCCNDYTRYLMKKTYRVTVKGTYGMNTEASKMARLQYAEQLWYYGGAQTEFLTQLFNGTIKTEPNIMNTYKYDWMIKNFPEVFSKRKYTQYGSLHMVFKVLKTPTC